MTKICVKSFERNSENFCRYTLYKVAKGIKKMHKNNVIHRDLKSDNILYSADGDIKIADMGFSCTLSEQRTSRKTKKGTPHWCAPEIQ